MGKPEMIGAPVAISYDSPGSQYPGVIRVSFSEVQRDRIRHTAPVPDEAGDRPWIPAEARKKMTGDAPTSTGRVKKDKLSVLIVAQKARKSKYERNPLETYY